ncbi:DnaB-like helicase C-terminal domain-containing protein [Enterococcus gallinarum]|uniref:DnaB-like helicase C-terminal domain-containing protein n=1 Tax=Enterococcus gallinarum TaxID=1353 RepID=UPI0028913BC3|nr:DnaB-like helicase C-terminal domain-containing protein [Enterococcus gallinarum]MDT2697520.1 DnaB-like helicase C-terminal domain-containing protein [Enterococcus gallinarum]
MNNELRLVAEMLNNPSIITNIDIDSEWFESPQCKLIVEAMTRLRGMKYTTEQVHREMRTIDYFKAGTADELDILKNSANQLGIERELARIIHNDYLDRKLHSASIKYAETLSKTDGDKLSRLLEEKRDVNHIKCDGKLDKAFSEFSENLDKPSDVLTTYKPLDAFLGGGLTGGKLIVLAGRPATGKTAFALNIMHKLFTDNENVQCDFFTFEMGQNELMTRLVSKETHINSLLFVGKDKLSQENKVKARKAYEEMKNTFDLRVYTSEYSNLNDIKYAIKQRLSDKKYVVFVDYAGLITVNDTRKNERQVMNEVTRELKKLTTDYGITIVLLAQLSRAVEQRQDKRPMLSDLKESGSLEQDANVTLLLSADDKDSRKIRCDVAKNREGMTGVAPFIFDKKFMDFSVDFDEWRG